MNLNLIKINIAKPKYKYIMNITEYPNNNCKLPKWTPSAVHFSKII